MTWWELRKGEARQRTALDKVAVITDVVLADHLRSLDWQVRNAEKADRVSRQVMAEILERIALLLGLAKGAH